MDPATHCPDCFKPPAPDPVCRHCGFDPRRVSHDASLLPPFTPLAGGRYLTGRVLGKPGGFGVVYAGVQTGAVAVPVAIKEFFPANQGQPLARRSTSGVEPVPGMERDYAQWKARFVKEAAVLAGLGHRRIVKLHDFFEERGTAYLVMERLHGSTLADWLGGQSDRDPSKLQRALPPGDTWALLMAALESLEVLHARGIVHRDLNPNNLFLEGDRPEGVKLLDFGLASPVESGNPLLTSIGVGAPPYMAPEQAQPGPNDEITTAADCYSLAATLYCALTGSAPRSASERRAGFAVSDLSRLAGLDPGLGRVLMDCLVLDWRGRPKDAMEVRRRLEARTLILEPVVEHKPAPRQGAERSEPKLEPKLKPEPEPKPERKFEPKPEFKRPQAGGVTKSKPNVASKPKSSLKSQSVRWLALISILVAPLIVAAVWALWIYFGPTPGLDWQSVLVAIFSGSAPAFYWPVLVSILALAVLTALAVDWWLWALDFLLFRTTRLGENWPRSPADYGQPPIAPGRGTRTRRPAGRPTRRYGQAPIAPDRGTSPGSFVKQGTNAASRFVKLGIGGAPLPDDAGVWYCVKDKTTGLIWEYCR